MQHISTLRKTILIFGIALVTFGFSMTACVGVNENKADGELDSNEVHTYKKV